MIQPNDDIEPLENLADNQMLAKNMNPKDVDAYAVNILMHDYLGDDFKAEGTINGEHWFVVGFNQDGLVVACVSNTPMGREDFYEKHANSHENWLACRKESGPTGDANEDIRTCVTALYYVLSEYKDNFNIKPL
jgi:hypothetical protein